MAGRVQEKLRKVATQIAPDIRAKTTFDPDSGIEKKLEGRHV